MPKLNLTSIAALVIIVQTALPVQATKNDVSKTHELLNSKGRVVASEVTTHPAPRPKAYATAQRRIRSSGRRDTMVQAIHQAARRPEYAYRSR